MRMRGAHSVAALYRSLAIGDYMLGRTDLRTAADLAGISISDLIEAVRARALTLDCHGTESGMPMLSIVVPVFNNATTLRELHARLNEVLISIGTFEILFVDDGSSDGSVDIIRELCEMDRAVRLIRLSRNFGQQVALTAGLDASRGSAVVMMDADLQDPPELIVDLVARWRAGYEVVYAVRKKRKENAPKRCAYALFYRIFRYLAEVDIPLDAGDFSLVDHKVVTVLRDMRECSRFLRGLRSWSGFRQTSVAYDRPPRPSGKSQYTLRRLLRLAADGLLGFSSAPLRLTALLGITTAVLGTVMLVIVLLTRLSTPSLPLGWASNLSVILLLDGIQLTTIGMVGAYVARIYAEVKNRPLYIVMERLGS